MKQKITALVVMSPDHRLALLEALEACGVDVRVAADCEEACRTLRRRPPVSLLLSAVLLRDGGWWIVREEIKRAELPVEIILCLAKADGGVTDLFEAGASDVLLAPYRRDKVAPVIEAAAARSYMRTKRAAAEGSQEETA